jgi:hypothetical protein
LISRGGGWTATIEAEAEATAGSREDDDANSDGGTTDCFVEETLDEGATAIIPPP